MRCSILFLVVYVCVAQQAHAESALPHRDSIFEQGSIADNSTSSTGQRGIDINTTPVGDFGPAPSQTKPKFNQPGDSGALSPTPAPKPLSEDLSSVDETPEMQTAWDEWHKRVASAVFVRFQMMATTAFARSRPMAAVAAYTVTRDGRILNARLSEKNSNPIYNAIVLTAIQQLDGNLEVLMFPAGSSRTSIDQVGTFIHNNGSAPVGDFGLYDARPVIHQKEYAR